MVTVKYLFFVLPYVIQGALSNEDEPLYPDIDAASKRDPEYPAYYADYGKPSVTSGDYADYGKPTVTSGDYADYGKPTVTYGDYADYGKPTVTYVDYADYGKPTVTYGDYADYGKPTVTYGDYADYGKPTVTYGDYADYGKPTVTYGDYADYGKPAVTYSDYARTFSPYGSQYAGDYYYGNLGHEYLDYYQYYEDYTYTTDDHYHDYFGFGDRINPVDTALGVYDETGLNSEIPWVYIIVPVVQIDVFYVSDEEGIEHLEDIDLEMPIETFLFELGEFGLGHFGMEEFSFAELGWGDHSLEQPSYDFEYEDYPIYGHYPNGAKAQYFDSAEELDEENVLEYGAYDFYPSWLDWIFMVPPDNADPAVR